LNIKNTPFVPLHKLINSGAAHQHGKQRKMGTVDKVVVLCVFTVGNTLTLFNVQAKQNIWWSADKANQYTRECCEDVQNSNHCYEISFTL